MGRALTLFILAVLVNGVFSLFDTDGHVVVLTAENYGRITTQGDTAWVVNLYSKFCGHCQRFAPLWKRAAEDTQGWRRVVRLAAVACSTPSNRRLCTKLGVFGYPTVKFFPPNAGPSARGVRYRRGDYLDRIRQASIDYLQEWLSTNERPSSWPPLSPCSSPEQMLLQYEGSEHLFVVAQDGNNDYLAQEIILDLSVFYPSIAVCLVRREHAYAFGITQFPSVYSVGEGGRLQPLVVSPVDRETIVRRIKVHAQETPAPDRTVVAPETPAEPEKPIKYTPPDGVHSQDLESVIFYSLWHEVPGHPHIAGEDYNVLKRYIEVLAKYYAGPRHVVSFLRRASNWLHQQDRNITGTQWTHVITSLQDRYSHVPARLKWTGCKGSQSWFRGYPCAMWTLFHSLTVNAVYYERSNPLFDPKEVPLVINDYIQTFFGCRECARNFGQKAAHIRATIVRRNDAILWLWRSHNVANYHLHNDPTEDPEQAKIQFPSAEACPRCGSKSTGWNEDEVLRYLKGFYNRAALIRDAYPPVLMLPEDVSHGNRPSSCTAHEDEWSSCSRSCGMGISTRLANNNVQCESRLEMRICIMEACNRDTRQNRIAVSKLVGTCDAKNATYELKRPVLLRFGQCSTSDSIRFRYCATCPGQCCVPGRERTVRLAMKCRRRNEEIRAHANVQLIDDCMCEDGSCITDD